MIKVAYFLGSIYLIYLAYLFVNVREQSRRFLSTALFLSGIFLYITFIYISDEHLYYFGLIVQFFIYATVIFFFYLSLKSLLVKVTWKSLYILALIFLFLFLTLLAPMSLISKGVIMMSFLYILLALLFFEARKINVEISEDLRRDVRNYTLIIGLTVTFAFLLMVFSSYHSLPPLDIVAIVIGYSFLYPLFRRG